MSEGMFSDTAAHTFSWKSKKNIYVKTLLSGDMVKKLCSYLPVHFICQISVQLALSEANHTV